MFIHQSKKFLRPSVAFILLIALLISSCSKNIDTNLSNSCEKLTENLNNLYTKSLGLERILDKNMNRFQSLGANWTPESRQETISYVNENFPFFSKYLNEKFYDKFLQRESNDSYKFAVESLIGYIILEEALMGTDFKLEISKEQLEAIENPTEISNSRNSNLVDGELNRIMGSITNTESGIAGSSGCSLITALRYKSEGGHTDGQFFYTAEEFLLHVDPGSIFRMRVKDAFETIFFRMSDPVLCEVTGETEEYQSIGDGTPGTYSVTKCRI